MNPNYDKVRCFRSPQIPAIKYNPLIYMKQVLLKTFRSLLIAARPITSHETTTTAGQRSLSSVGGWIEWRNHFHFL